MPLVYITGPSGAGKSTVRSELGDKAGLDLTYIGRIERGEQNTSLAVIGMVAKGLDVSPGTLFKGL